MVSYKKIAEEKDRYIYEYYPEGNEDAPGMVWVSPNGKEWGLISMPDDSFSAYYVHTVMDICDHAKAGIFKETGEVEWYPGK